MRKKSMMTHPVDGILAEDLMMEIISKIPARFLVRLRCVCKSWNALITDNFVSKQLNRSNNARNFFLLHGFVQFVPSFRLYEEPCIPYDTNPMTGRKLEFFKNLYFPDRFEKCIVAGSINGIICLSCVTRSHTRFVVLWNPAINYWKLICLPLFEDEDLSDASIGLAFDSLTNDYKIISLVPQTRNFNRTSYARIEVYSAKQVSWSIASLLIPFVTTRPNCSLIVKGVPYWLNNFVHPNDDFRSKFIVSVDPHTDSCRKIPYPEKIGLNQETVHPFNLMDSLALLFYSPRDQTFQVYALDDCAPTWINVYSTATTTILLKKDISILRCFEDAGKTVVLGRDRHQWNDYFLYDLKSDSLIDGIQMDAFRPCWDESYQHVESLVYIPGMVKIQTEDE